MDIRRWQIAGTVFTLVLGTLLHFTYDWSGQNSFVGMFSAVNESTWEHLKLLAVPMLLFGIVEYFSGGKAIANYAPAKLLSILFGMFVIVVAFYTYVGIVGQNYLWADIGTFVLGVLAAHRLNLRLLQSGEFSSPFAVRMGWIGLILLAVCFVVFTCCPPHIGLFRDPVTGGYGKTSA